MNRKYIILIIFLLGLFEKGSSQNLHGLWKDAYWDPMDTYYSFNTIDSTFKEYFLEDLYGIFAKGKFSVNKKVISFQYDSIICDKPIIELLDDDLIIDTTYIAFFHYWGLPKRVDIIEKGNQLYSSWTSNSDSIIEDYLLIKIPKRIDSIKVEVYNSFGSIDKELLSFNVRLFQKPYCNLYYYPSGSWYKYEQPHSINLRIKWDGPDSFILGKKGNYKKIK